VRAVGAVGVTRGLARAVPAGRARFALFVRLTGTAGASASVRSWIFGTSVLVGSSVRYVPATARGTNSKTARIAYFTRRIVPSEKERKIKLR